jgi:DNA-binding transcriptional MerR regulator
MMLASSKSSASREVLPVRHAGSVEPRTFSTSELADLSDVTLRQLQYWDERNVIRPRFRGFHQNRDYSFLQAVLVKMAARLRSNGVPLPRIKSLVHALRSDSQFNGAVERHTDLYLLISPKIAKKVETPGRVLEVMRDFRGSFILIPVHDFVAEFHRQELVN